MKRKKYIQPQTEAITIEVGYSILVRASNWAFVDPIDSGNGDGGDIEDNDDDDFGAGAKKHDFNYHPFENYRVGY